MSEKESRCFEGEDLDCRQITEACQLYGFDRLECTHDKTADKGDADSIISEESGKDAVPLQDRVNSRLLVVREADSGQSLWRIPMEESDTIANHISANSKLHYRLPCHSFRSLLPPLLEERPPIRNSSWFRSCMKGVLFSYLDDRSSCQAVNNTNKLIRFPEFVYCWFADEDEEDQSSADEDRWAFYYALKSSIS